MTPDRAALLVRSWEVGQRIEDVRRAAMPGRDVVSFRADFALGFPNRGGWRIAANAELDWIVGMAVGRAERA